MTRKPARGLLADVLLRQALTANSHLCHEVMTHLAVRLINRRVLAVEEGFWSALGWSE
jgi:hypothetical protein